MKKDKYIWGFQIVGSDCGYDQFGTFHCACGHCLPLRVDVSKGGKYRGSDCGDGRYDGEKHVDKKPPFLRACFRAFGFDKHIYLLVRKSAFHAIIKLFVCLTIIHFTKD